MEKIKVKLKDSLDKSELGFYDLSVGAKVAPKNFGKGESFEVEETDFISNKISTGELVRIEEATVEVKETPPAKK